jgi:WD40 repeat protein
MLPDDETYEVSPLIQYAMTVPNNTTQTSVLPTQHHYDGPMTSLVPLSKRLNPTMGAIYSLHFYQNWLVGAGKAGMIAIWDHTTTISTPGEEQQDSTNKTTIVDPVLSWKAHAGRWVAEVRFIANGRRLLTAANDGCVCVWDVTTVSTQQQIPKCLSQTGKGLHTSGIFALDVLETTSSNVLVATASKDKTVQLSILDQTWGWWKSDHHSAKVGDVRFKGTDSSLLASVGDDGLVVVHDYKSHRIVAESSTAHQRPHSVAWHPTHEHLLLTAGHDRTIKLWDIRRFGGDGGSAVPLGVLEGHVPVQETRCKRIHRPVWYQHDYVLTGGQSSHALSAFHTRFSENQSVDVSMMCRGRLPEECGDAGCIAVDGSRVAVSTEGAEILLLEPSTACRDEE